MTRSRDDIWSQWLLERRFSGDPDRAKEVLDRLSPIRDKVLDHVNLTEHDVLLDVGCGDGLIAFGALERYEKSHVIFLDISQELLGHARHHAEELQMLDRCHFMRASAEDELPLDDGSVDSVATRSVLIYVSAKRDTFEEFHRVLRAGGQLSIFEPINRFGYPEPPHLLWGYDVTPVMELAEKVKAVYMDRQPPHTDPMLDFDERDLIAFAEQAGFKDIHLELNVEIRSSREGKRSTTLRCAPNPKAPTLEEAINEALDPGEANLFSAYLRPLVVASNGTRRSAVAYLWASKEWAA